MLSDISIHELDPTRQFNITITGDAENHGGSTMSGYGSPNTTIVNRIIKTVPNGVYTVTAISGTNPMIVCILVNGKSTWVDMSLAYSDEDGNKYFNAMATTSEDAKRFQEESISAYNTINTVPWATADDDERTIGETAVRPGALYSNRSGEVVVMYADDPNVNTDSVYSHYLTLATKAYGAPPQWTPYADPRISQLRLSSNHVFLLGRKYLETVISAPTILSLAPGVIKYNSALGELLSQGGIDDVTPDMFGSKDGSGKIVEFTPCWYNDVEGGNHGYIKYVATLNKATLVAMSRAEPNNGDTPLVDRLFPGSDLKYSEATDVWLKWNNSDNDVSRIYSKGILGAMEAVSDLISDGMSSIVSYKYVNFYCSGNNSTRENFETSVRSSMIEDIINSSVGSAVKDVAYFTGGLIGEPQQQQIDSWVDSTSKMLGPLGNIVSMASAMFNGARLIFPQIVDDCTFGRDSNFTVRFVAGSSDIEARYLMRCEYNHLLALALPRQVAGKIDMYTTPFLVRGLCKGRWNCEMGVVTGFQVTYGGQDDGAWTQDSQPTEIEVSFSVTPLYSKLVMSSYDDINTWFLRNTGMMEYILTNCGVDLRISQPDMKLEMAAAMASEAVDFTRQIDGIMEGIFNNKFTNVLKSAFNW